MPVELTTLVKSLSARRAWIEILFPGLAWKLTVVALRKESVDRNLPKLLIVHLDAVALRKESVDRNINQKEHTRKAVLSLSARRAWIEMPPWAVHGAGCRVALRKESVDRNRAALNGQAVQLARRSPQGERG